MSFNGTEGATIVQAAAGVLTKRYRDNHAGAIKGFFIGKNHLENLLAQTDCMGIRIYLGEETTGLLTVVLVGANSNEDDILATIVDNAIKCPPRCGSKNKLNND